MKREIPAREAIEAGRKEPEFVAAYDELEEEFSLAEAIIRARAEAGMTQEQVAKAMGTTQTVIARLESGQNMPSTRTLQKFARATGMTLKITFRKRNFLFHSE